MRPVGIFATLLGAMWSVVGAIGVAVVSTGPWRAWESAVYGVASASFAVLGLLVLRGGIDAARNRPSGIRGLAAATRLIAVLAVAIGAVIGAQVVAMGVHPVTTWLASVAVSTAAGVAMAHMTGVALRRRLAALEGDASANDAESPEAAAGTRSRVTLMGPAVLLLLLVGLVLVLRAGAVAGLRRAVLRSVAAPAPGNLVPTVCIRGQATTAGPHPPGQPATGALENRRRRDHGRPVSRVRASRHV